ncbi:MAG: FtsX-like permease family protein [Planctomycetota bacterium]
MALPINYSLRNLAVRRTSTLLTFVIVAVIVFVLAVLLSFAAGIKKSLAVSGASSNLLVLAPGATAEGMSFILPEEVSRLVQTPGIAFRESGSPLISPEVLVQTNIPRVGPDGNLANVAVRGVDEAGFTIHSGLNIIEGRRFQQGIQEVIVGRAAQNRYVGLSIGSEIQLGKMSHRQFKIVGVFEAAGAAIESEIWGPRTVMGDAYGRSMASSVILRLVDGADVEKAIEYINGPAVELEAKRETDYYKDLSSKTKEIVVLSSILVGIMAVGAIFAVANTMYASVDRRRREIAMLRTVGFGRFAVVSVFMVESVLVCIPACIVGLVGSLFLSGRRDDFFSDETFTVLAYEWSVTPGVMVTCLVVSALVAIIGAWAPAMRASRTGIIETLRKA